MGISIHVLREEDDTHYSRRAVGYRLFLSTSSARRTTPATATISPLFAISIHVLREEDDFVAFRVGSLFGYFYPRPPRGGRPPTPYRIPVPTQFLSTSSARRTTANSMTIGERIKISIHVLREEDDNTSESKWSIHHYFYPRPPRGGRLQTLSQRLSHNHFYPRPPRGGRLLRAHLLHPGVLFLSTSSARRTTASYGNNITIIRNFYPRPPRGGRHPVMSREP